MCSYWLYEVKVSKKVPVKCAWRLNQNYPKHKQLKAFVWRWKLSMKIVTSINTMLRQEDLVKKKENVNHIRKLSRTRTVYTFRRLFYYNRTSHTNWIQIVGCSIDNYPPNKILWRKLTFHTSPNTFHYAM